MKVKLGYTISCMLMTYPVFANMPSFVSDIVARDLVWVNFAGHVGIASAPDYRMRPTVVLEALDTVPHIQENTIDDFKSRSKYWGSRGGLVKPQTSSAASVASSIVRQYYACPEYTIKPTWREGTIDNRNRPIICALFRCDTLVNYAYAHGPGYKLPTYDTLWTTPLSVWNSFPLNSDLLVPENYNNQLTLENPPITNDNLDSINENNLKDLTEKNLYNMFINSPNISKEKICYLWKLFTSNEVNNDVKILFYDFISSENIDYLTNEIVKQAKLENGKARHKLLVALQFIYQKSLGEKQNTDLKEITDYFKELQLLDLDKDDGGIVYRGLASLAPEYIIDTKKANLITMDKIHVDIFLIESNRSNEIYYVNNIIYNLDHPDDRLVVTATYQYLTQLLINSNLNFFSNESKQLFREYLDKKNMIDHNQSIVYTSAYVEFKAALNAKKSKEIPKLTSEYLKLLHPDN